MPIVTESKRARRALVLLHCLLAATTRAAAEDIPPALNLSDAAELAVAAQPLLDTLDAQGRAAHELAIAARQLPDPKLNFGIADLPIDTHDAFSFTRDSDTQIQVGVTQDFPRAEKRRLRGELGEREVARLSTEHQLAERTIRRDAALAWVDLWRYDRALALTRDQLREASTELQTVEISLKTGSATQAEYLSARLEVSRLRDAVRGAKQNVTHAQNALSRWIGEAAFRPVSPDPTALAALPPLETVLDRVHRHPLLASAEVRVAQAQTSAELAEAAYQADWRVALGYSHRPEFSEMVMLEVSVDLPLFKRNRQDRNFAAALAQKDAAESTVENLNRQLMAEARLNHHDFARLGARLREYEATLLPQSAARTEAAVAGWRAGRDRLREVLEARRTALELRLARLDLQSELSKHFVQLSYLGAFDSEAPAEESLHE